MSQQTDLTGGQSSDEKGDPFFFCFHIGERNPIISNIIIIAYCRPKFNTFYRYLNLSRFLAILFMYIYNRNVTDRCLFMNEI